LERFRAGTGLAVVWIGALLAFLVIVELSYWGHGSSSGFVFARGLDQIGGLQLWDVVGAFIIGAFGSIGFLVTVAAGLVPYSAKPSIQAIAGSLGLCGLYVFLGGFIAAVFQVAQPGTFAPIQALIVGVTWPAIVNQYLGGQKSDPSKAYETIDPNETAGVAAGEAVTL
jgi:hypothetical protein